MTDSLHTNPPAPQVVNKASRMTAHKRAVLQCLADLGANYLEWGTPPYALSLLAEQMGTDVSNLSKTMRALERSGLVVREVASINCWNAIAQNDLPRRCVCYWLAETLEADKQRALSWLAGTNTRAEQALQNLSSQQQRGIGLC